MSVVHPDMQIIIGKGDLFGHKLLNTEESNSSNLKIIDLFWSRIIGNYQINFWYNMEPNLIFGTVLNSENPIYEVPDLGLDCFDMEYLMYAAVYGAKRIKWLTDKAKIGNCFVQYKLALMYVKGNGVKQNFKKALKWYKYSADSGYPLAISDLGCMYFNGMGVEKDVEKAMSYWALAATEDYPPAQNNLGFIFQNGIGVTTDYAKAFDLFQKAANKEYALAQHNLGYMYANGLGVKKNHQEAFRFYSLAAEQGCLSSQNLGCMLASGMRVEQQLNGGKKLLNKATVLPKKTLLYRKARVSPIRILQKIFF